MLTLLSRNEKQRLRQWYVEVFIDQSKQHWLIKRDVFCHLIFGKPGIDIVQS